MCAWICACVLGVGGEGSMKTLSTYIAIFAPVQSKCNKSARRWKAGIEQYYRGIMKAHSKLGLVCDIPGEIKTNKKNPHIFLKTHSLAFEMPFSV